VRRRQAPSEGLWAIPGGRVELGETLQQAAEREIREETGITVKAGRPIYVFDVVDTDTANRVRFHYVIIDLMAEFVAGEPCAADDALDARWVDFAELSHLPVSGATLDLLENVLGVACRVR